MAFTKVVGAGIHTLAQLQTHNIHSAGIITATSFVGNIGGNPTFSGDATFNGNVSIGGTLTYEDVKNVDSVGLGTFREGIFIPDNKHLKIGNTASSPDLSVYHDGNNSYINESGTGSLIIRGADVEIQTVAGNRYFTGASNTAKLYHSNDEKLATYSGGVSVSGSIVASGNIQANTNITISNIAPQLFLVDTNNDSDFAVQNINGSFTVNDTTNSVDRFIINSSGAVGIATATPIGDFTVLTDGNGYLGIDGGGGKGAEINVYHKDTKANTFKLANNGGSNELAQYILTNTSGKHIWWIGGSSGDYERMRLTTTGLGIGTDNPTQALHIYNSSPIIRLTDTDTLVSAQINATNGNLYFDTTNNNRDVIFRGGSTEVARITGDGKVGIGTADPQVMHHLYSASGGLYTRFESTNSQVNFGNSNGAGIIQVTSTSQPLRFLVNGSNERARIASDGKFGIGDFSSGSVAQALHVKGSDTKIYLEHVGGYDLTVSTNTGAGQCGILVNGGYLDLCSNNRDLVACLYGGSVGIGSATPAQKLNVVGNVQIGSPTNTSRNLIFSADRGANADLGNIIAKNTGGNIAAIKFHSGADGTNKDDGQITFHTSPHSSQQLQEHLRIDEGGTILMGITDSHSTVLGSRTPKIQIESTSVSASSIFLNRDGNDGGGSFLFLGHGRGGNGLVQSGDNLGNLTFVGGDGTNFRAAAEISANVDGTPSSGSDMPGRLIFKVTGDNQGTPYEKMRITNHGQVVIGHNGVGVGTDMADDLTIATGGHTGMTIRSGTSHYGSIYFADGVPDGTDVDQRGVIRYQHSDDDFVFCTNGNTPRVRISHNVVSLGNHAQKTWSLGNVVNVGAQENNLWGESGNGFHMMQNAYYNSGYKHVSNDMSTLYTQYQGQHIWYTAAAGSSDAAISFTEKLHINSNGRVNIGDTYNTNNDLDYCRLSIYGQTSQNGTNKNLNLLNVYNYGSGNPGDITGIGLGAAASPDYTKASLAFIRTTSYGRGDLIFCVNAEGNANMVTESDERLRIDGNGRLGISHNLAGTSDYNRLMIHNPHSGSCWLQMTSTASGATANTDGLSIGLNSSNIAHIWHRENTEMVFATSGLKRMEITANGTTFVSTGTAPVNQCEAQASGGSPNTLGLMVKRSICVSDSDTKGQGMIMVSHTKSLTCDGTTYNMIKLRNREGCFIGDVYVGFSAGGSGAVRHKKFHCYYGASTATDVNNPGGRLTGDGINVNISSSTDHHFFQVIPDNSGNSYQNGSTINVTMTIMGLSAGAAGSDAYDVTYY